VDEPVLKRPAETDPPRPFKLYLETVWMTHNAENDLLNCLGATRAFAIACNRTVCELI
jgi:hypothetical protein